MKIVIMQNQKEIFSLTVPRTKVNPIEFYRGDLRTIARMLSQGSNALIEPGQYSIEKDGFSDGECQAVLMDEGDRIVGYDTLQF